MSNDTPFTLALILHRDDLPTFVDEEGDPVGPLAACCPSAYSTNVMECDAEWRLVSLKARGDVDALIQRDDLMDALDECERPYLAEVYTTAFGTVISATDMENSPIREIDGAPVNPCISGCFLPASILSWPAPDDMGETLDDLYRMLNEGQTVDVQCRLRAPEEVDVGSLNVLKGLRSRGRLNAMLKVVGMLVDGD